MHESGMQAPEWPVSLEKGHLKGKPEHMMDSSFSVLPGEKGLTT